MGNDIGKDDDFDRYLQSLVVKEGEKQEQAIDYYREWAEHFEMVKANFEQVMDLFCKISQTLPRWECSGPCSKEQVPRDVPANKAKSANSTLMAYAPLSPMGLDGDGYYFKASLSCVFEDDVYWDDEDNPSMLKHGIEVCIINSNAEYGKGIGDLSKITSHQRGYCLPPLEEVVGSRRFSSNRAKSLLEMLDYASIEFKVWHNSEEEDDEDYSNNIGIGYLYEHNLADLCKEIFKKITDEDSSIGDIEELFPSEEYLRRDPDDNNIHHALGGDGWRNE
jgi:hypothetical protein